MKKLAFSLFLLLFLLSSVSLAVPHEINYQGVLKDSSGALVSGKVNMIFHIYNGPDPAAQSLWYETQNGVTVEAGLYSVRLGSQTAISPEVFDGNTRYLGVTVVGDIEMTPRIPLISVPYAFRAEHAGTADTVGSISPEAFVQLGPSTAQTTGAQYGLNVKSSKSLGIGMFGGGELCGGSFEADGYAVYARGDDYGVYSVANNYGIYGKSLFYSGIGVHGIATSTSGTNYGVYGESLSEYSIGVYGFNPRNIGVCGKSEEGPGVTGVSTNDAGVVGESINSHGVYGVSHLPSDEAFLQLIAGVTGQGEGIGVKGEALHGYGVYGKGRGGVLGYSEVTNGYGVAAINTAPTSHSHGGAALYIQGKIKAEKGPGEAVGSMNVHSESWSGGKTVTISNPICTTTSLVYVFPLDRQPMGRWFVTRADGSFIVHSNANEINDPNFAYLIIN